MGQTIPTCRLRLIATALVATPTFAATTSRSSPLSVYVQARMADAAGESGTALSAYTAAMIASPGNELVALRAYREAVESGDRVLALRAARQLHVTGALPADARLLLFIDALDASDWKAARLMLDQIERQGGYDFLVPIMRAWTSFSARDGDPIALIDAQPRGSLTGSYAGEHRALILAAQGKLSEAATTLKALGLNDARLIPARLSVAAQIGATKDKAGADTLLVGNDAALMSARGMVANGTPLVGRIDTARKGTAALLSRVASDLMRDRVSPVALTLARLARFADPGQDQVLLTQAQALEANGRYEEALAGFRLIPVTSVYAGAAHDGIVSTLQKLKRADEALALANLMLSKPDASLSDHLRVGEIHDRAGRNLDAAKAYRNAITVAEKGGGNASWGLWLLYGGALEKSGDWIKGKAALQRAVELGVDQPSALNYLGYAMLERRENLPEATRLLSRAIALKPGDAAITDSLGWAYFLQGDTKQAIMLLEEAVLGAPTDATLGEHLGDAYWQIGRRVDARYAWRAAALQAEGAGIERLMSKLDFGPSKVAPARW